MSSIARWDHKHADRIVASETGGTSQPRDVPGAPPGTHDFDVVLPGGRVIAVEVTIHAAQDQLGLHAAIRKTGEWTYPELACSWYLIIDEAVAHVRELHAEAGVLLTGHPGVLADINGFRPRPESRLYQLGVRGVRKLAGLKPPQVICEADDFDPAILECAGGQVICEAIEQLAARKRGKLERAAADERHLFVWIDWFQKAALADLRFTGLPRAIPELPATIDAVWVAEAFCPGRVLTYSRCCGWADLGTWQS